MLVFALTRAVVIAAIGFSAYGYGAPVLGRLRLAGDAERAALGVTLGLGVLGTASLVLGLAGALTRTSVEMLLACGAALAVLAWWRRRADAEARPPRPGWLWSAAIALGAAALALALVRALYPPTAFDATLYHLPMAKAYAMHGRVAPNPELRFPVFPALNEILFADALLVRDDVTAQLLETLFFALVTLGVVIWGTREAGDSGGFWACALWIANPVVFSLASVAYVDMGLAAFAFFAVYACARWLESEDPGWARVAGALAGFAAATKYSGLLFVGLVGSALLLGLVRRRAGTSRAFLAFAAAAALAGGAWYVLDAVWTGNPIWPFASRFFGLRFWDSVDVASLDWSLHRYGWGRNPADLDQPLVLPLLFLLFPIAVWAAIRRPEIRFPVIVTGAFFVFWFGTTQQVRFLLPSIPLLSVLGACGLAAAVEAVRAKWRRRSRLAATIVMAILAMAALTVVLVSIGTGPAVPTTAPERERYLQRLPSYPFYRDLHRKAPGNSAVYALHDENMRYYCEGRFLGDWFGPNRFADVPLTTSRELFDWLSQRDVAYLLVNESRMVTRLPADAEFPELFERVYANGPVVAYALKLR